MSTNLTPSSGEGGARRALIVANDTYEHASLSQLRAPEADARALAGVLGNPDVGAFEVSVVHNAASYEVQAHIDDLFADSGPDDLLLLHFSGHGLKSDTGELFFAARNTRPDRLKSTSVAAEFVQACMRSARARQVVLFLDCCYGGAFGEGVAVRAAGPVNVADSFPAGRLGGGRGRAVISASSAIEYAFEGTTLTADHEPQPSIFTSAVVQGLTTGEADRDEDGYVSLGELYDYVFDRVREQNPRQTPGRDIEMSGEVYLARSKRKRIRAVPISEGLRTALANSDPTYRLGVVLELRNRLARADLGVALGALEALQEIARSDTQSVADEATAVLAAALPVVSPAALDFGPLNRNADVAVDRVLTVSGIPLAQEVRVEADAPLTVAVDGNVITVTLSPTGQPYAGAIDVIAPTGSVVVPVQASVAGISAEQVVPTMAAVEIGEPALSPVPPEPSERSELAPPPDAPEAAAPATALRERRLAPVAPADVEPKRTPERSESAGPQADTADQAAYGGDGGEGPQSTRASAWLSWLLLGSGVLVVVSSIWFRSMQGVPVEVVLQLLLTIGASGLCAICGAVLMMSGARPDAVCGWLVGCVAGALAGGITVFALYASPSAAIFPRLWLTLLGQAMIVVVGVGAAFIVARRVSISWDRVGWRDPATWLVVGAAGVIAAAFVSLGASMAGSYASSALVTLTGVLALLTIVVAALGLTVRPSATGRLMILAWSVSVVGFAISGALGRLVFYKGNFERPQMPIIAVAVVALAIGAALIGRRSAGIQTEVARPENREGA